MKIGLSGHFKLTAVNAKTGKTRELAEFDNLILDQGLNALGTQGCLRYCQVGSGSTAPEVTDSGLQSYVAGTQYLSTSQTAQSTAPYYATRTVQYRFAPGVAAGNLSEVGIAWATSGPALFSRALIKDAEGDPTTITVLSDEYLDVTYSLRSYPPLVDSTFNVTINGVEHACVLRAAKVTNDDYWAPDIVTTPVNFGWNLPSGTTYGCVAYSGGINAITSQPSGTSSNSSTRNTATYASNSYSRVSEYTFDLNAGNVGAGGIASILMQTYIGTFQCSFTPAIAKDATKVLKLNLSVTWARRTL